MTRDPFLMADPRWIAAQRGANRHRSQPIVSPRIKSGHLPDPRTVPFTVSTISKARWHTILSGAVFLSIVVGCFILWGATS